MKVEVGTYKTDRHIAVIGQPTAFYIWVRKNREDTGRSSNWIRGDLPLYNKLAETLRKNKTEFIELATTMFKEHMSRTFRNPSYRDRSFLYEKKELDRTIQRVALEEQLIESEEIEETEIGFPEDWVDSYNEVSKN